MPKKESKRAEWTLGGSKKTYTGKLYKGPNLNSKGEVSDILKVHKTSVPKKTSTSSVAVYSSRTLKSIQAEDGKKAIRSIAKKAVKKVKGKK